MKKESISKLIKFLISIGVGLTIALIPTASGALTVEALRFLGIVVSMILLMVFKVFPDAVAVIMALVACYTFKVASLSGAFSGFASSPVWMAVTLIGFAAGLSQSGLMTRIAFSIMNLVKPTYKGQILAVMSAGTILGPCMPNTTAKLALMAPLSAQIVNANHYENNGKGAAGLFSATFFPCNCFGLCFLTGATGVYILLGMMPNESFSWLQWTGATIVWGITCLVGFYFFNIKAYKVEQETVSGDYIKNKLAEMGPMSGDEKFSLVLLIAGIVAWMTTSLTGLDNLTISLILWVLMIAKGLFKGTDIQSKISWVVILMMGGMTGISTLFTTTGVNAWLQEVLAPVLGGVVSNLPILIIVISTLVYIMRYVVTSMMACTTIMFAIFAPACEAIGISPFVVIWCAYTAANVWSTSFNNTMYIMSEGLFQGKINWKSIASSNYFFMIINVVANIACIPIWQMMGLA